MADAGARKSDADVGGSSRKRRKKNPPPQEKKTDADANANEIVELQMKLHRRHVDRTVANLWDAADAAGADAGGLLVTTFTGTNDTSIKLHMNGLLLSRKNKTKWFAIHEHPPWLNYLVSNGYEKWSAIELKGNREPDTKQAAMNYLLRCKVLGSDDSNAADACIASLKKNINQKWYDEVYAYFENKSFKNARS
jgi:hypothetical protein